MNYSKTEFYNRIAHVKIFIKSTRVLVLFNKMIEASEKDQNIMDKFYNYSLNGGTLKLRDLLDDMKIDHWKELENFNTANEFDSLSLKFTNGGK